MTTSSFSARDTRGPRRLPLCPSRRPICPTRASHCRRSPCAPHARGGPLAAGAPSFLRLSTRAPRAPVAGGAGPLPRRLPACCPPASAPRTRLTTTGAFLPRRRPGHRPAAASSQRARSRRNGRPRAATGERGSASHPLSRHCFPPHSRRHRRLLRPGVPERPAPLGAAPAPPPPPPGTEAHLARRPAAQCCAPSRAPRPLARPRACRTGTRSTRSHGPCRR